MAGAFPALFAAVYQFIYCMVWASPCSGDSSLAVSSVFPLGFPHPRLQVLSTTVAMAWLSAQGSRCERHLSLSLSVYLCAPFLFGCQTIKWKFSAMKKNYGSGLQWFVLSCLCK